MKTVNGTPYLSGNEARIRCVELVKALQETRTLLQKTREDCVSLAQYVAHVDQRMDSILMKARGAISTITQHVLTPPAVKRAIAEIIEHATPPTGPLHETNAAQAQDAAPQNQPAEAKPAPMEG